MMRQKQFSVSASLISHRLTEQPLCLCLILGFLGCCPGCPLGHRLPRMRQCCQGRAGMVLVAVWDCNADSAEPKQQTPLAVSNRAWSKLQFLKSLTLGAPPPSTLEREAEGRGDPVSLVQWLPQSSRETGKRIAASSLRGSCAPCSHTGSSLPLKCLQMIPV